MSFPPAISMVLCTEYRIQSYSMGSSDPLPARFEILFGSLNFQATRNGYHQPRRTPPVAVDEAGPNACHACH
jgi:hypothetical protein